ncbi:LLM class flavin-dependent oxidoreductase [Microbispora sp. H10836]|uniref:LLM class flavin-dependent oxidoreductase n=1 Tax=Microbispora sp. H10836 TaxID=2729106 RepID=UPI0014728A87|nr:LLM class flavin-dependent oxidoreductase [Microbispora sp. H10836]
MRRSLVLATDVWGPTVELAQLAERRGLHRVWTTEYATRDAAVRALALGMVTTDLRVGTGISYAFTRLPLATAAMAADVQLVTRGRFSLGLGAGTRGMRERFYGQDGFARPAPRLAEYVGLLRAAWAARGDLQFQGDFYSASVPGYRPNAELDTWGPPPVYGSGLNATMIRYAAASCDGVALHPLASERHYLDAVVLPAMAAGAENRDVRLAAWMVTSVDEDGALARARVKSNLAFYFSTPSYRTVVEGTSWEPVAAAVRDRFREIGPRWSDIALLVPDEMAEAFSLAGTPEAIAARLPVLERELGERGVDEVVFQTVGIGLDDAATVDNIRRIIEAAGAVPVS